MAQRNAPLAHMVYFTLQDNSRAECDRLIAACKKYLFDHPGVITFNVGPRADDLVRDVNDLEFDVGLAIVFQDKATHDAYQITEPHNTFIQECQGNWERVRVFDTLLA